MDVGELYGRYSRSVYRRARQLLGDDDSARDATQEVFLRVIRAGGRVPAEPTPTAWLHRVTTNLCLNRLRDRKRHSALLSAEGPPPTSTGAVGEVRAVVLQVMERVPEDLQEVAIYYFVDELTYDEIARVLTISRRTVGNRLEAFRALVGQLFPDSRLAS